MRETEIAWNIAEEIASFGARGGDHDLRSPVERVSRVIKRVDRRIRVKMKIP